MHLGFIAQEVRDVVPEVVVDHGWQETPRSWQLSWEPLDRLGVSYSELIPVLVKAIQEQQEQIQMLKLLTQQLTSAIELHTNQSAPEMSGLR